MIRKLFASNFRTLAKVEIPLGQVNVRRQNAAGKAASST